MSKDNLLAESEARLIAIIQSSDDAIISKTLEGIVTSWNPAAEKLFGYSADEMIGQPITRIIPDDRLNEEPNILKRLSKGELVDHYQTKRRTKSGELLDISLTISPIRNKEGIIVGASKIARDITKMKRAEEELQRSEKNYKTLSSTLELKIEQRTAELRAANNQLNFANETYFHAEQTASFGTYRFNFETNELVYSENLYRILGCEPNEFPASGDYFLNFVHPDDRTYVQKATADAFVRHTPSVWEYRIIKKDGKQIWVRGTGKIMVDINNVQHMVGTLQDITSDKQREIELRKSEEKFNKLFSAAPLGLTLADSVTGELIDVNNYQLKMLGYRKEEFIGRNALALNLVDKDKRAEILNELKNKGIVQNVEFKIAKKNGELIPVLNSIESISIGDRKYNLSAIIDISNRKKIEKEIEDANIELKRINQELEAFTYVSSHDLQEPLRKIQTFIGRIRENGDHLSETSTLYFSRIDDAASKMKTLIQDLLAFSKVKTSERNVKPVDLHEIINSIKHESNDVIREKNVTINVGPTCITNLIPFQIHQLFQNLISNSIKFSKESEAPVITIKSKIVGSLALPSDFKSKTGDYCHIEYSDNGIGFEQEYSEKIFEVFQKLHPKHQYPGTGIGLAIVKRIIDNHHGYISASGKMGEGAHFDIYLPV
jgi:PAS domain S-box-containing protein